MNIAISLQRPSYKGNLHFDEGTYLGVIAFGNALGNSIVGKIQQTERDKKIAAQKAFDDLKKQY